MLDTQPASAAALLHGVETDTPLLLMWLAASTALLAALLTVTVAVCLSQRARYLRQLKAATAVAFGTCHHVTRPRERLTDSLLYRWVAVAGR